MKSFEKDILKLAEKTRLKAIEREMVRDRILSYMEYHPLKKSSDHVVSSRVFAGGNVIFINFRAPLFRYTAGFLALILIVGIPLVAERTVPGDVLYLVKTGINESIRTQLANTPYEKVELETKLMERRIAEARLLKEEGKLTADVETQIAETVKGHAEAVQSGIRELRAQDSEGAAIAEIVFNSALEVQSATLDHVAGASTTQGDALRAVVNTVRSEALTNDTSESPSYGGLVARVESETTRLYELFESVKKSATAEEVADIERRISDVNRTILEAKELSATDEPAATSDLVEVLGLIQKLITFMTDIDVRETVTLETLVPIKRTLEERSIALETAMVDYTKRIENVRAKRELLKDVDLREKVDSGLLLVADMDTEIKRAFKESTLDEGEAREKELEALLRDLENLTADIVLESIVPTDPDVPQSGEGSTTTLSQPESPTDTSTTSVPATDDPQGAS